MRAIISSSLVWITHTETPLIPVLMRGPPAASAAASSLSPASEHRGKLLAQAALFSIPAVKTMASSLRRALRERTQLAAIGKR